MRLLGETSLQGRVGFVTREGQGNVFSLDLPVKPPLAALAEFARLEQVPARQPPSRY